MTLGWSGALVAQDLDKDGVPDNQDPCPNEDEDKDGFQDFDGCPERDNDEDGIVDVADKCPIEAEDKDGTEDADGCPDPDNDGDNIPDALDKCPIEPRISTTSRIMTAARTWTMTRTACSTSRTSARPSPRTRTAIEDVDGCPDPDNDGDKIPDGTDKCPLEAETLQRLRGRRRLPGSQPPGGTRPPDADLVLKGREIPGQYHRAAGRLLCLALDSLAEKLKASPGTMVEIRAYMDKSGSELEQFRITEAWASTVRKYLVTLGVPPNQVLSRGMGARDPVAPNTTSGEPRQEPPHRSPPPQLKLTS